MMRRWYITGGAGSGKTTLAARVATILGVPHYDVDRGELPADDEDAWIVEGAHIWGMDRYVSDADVVVWLDLPARVTIPRIVARHVRLSLRGTNRHPGIRNLFWFATSQPAYYRKPARAPLGPTDWDALSRAATHDLLTSNTSEFVWLRTPRQVRRWQRGLALADG